MANPLTRRLRRAPVNMSRIHLDGFAAEAGASAAGDDFVVLDAGAGSMPYRKHFEHVRYEAADFRAAPGIDYVCDISSVPVEDGRFDLVLASQLLEHVKSPIAVLREFHRILKPGGTVWITAPLFYQEHMLPHDYYRYTRPAWRMMARRAGFEIDSLEWLEGYYGTLSYQLHVAYKALPRSMRATRLGLLHLSRRFARLEARERYTPKSGQPKNYRVVLRKPA
jgi:SAM-dependent methyltransferase